MIRECNEMGIRNGKRITPRQYAKQCVPAVLEIMFYVSERDPDAWEAMTTRERDEVQRQMEKIYNSIVTRLGVK